MKKIFKMFLFTLILTLSLASCGNTTDDIFNVSVVADFQSISPGSDISALSKSVLLNMNSSLYAYDPVSKEYTPSMAENVSLDGNVLTITLKPDLFFHNDEPVTSEDVVYSIKRNAGYVPDFLMFDAQLQKVIDEDAFNIVDDKTVTITLNEEFINNNLFYNLYNTIIVPVNYSEAEQIIHPISAGPYKFVSYIEGSEIVFEKFDKYFGEEPEIEQVRFRIISDVTSALMAFKNGEIDYISLQPEDAVNFKGTEFEETVYSALSNDSNTLFLNNEVKPFDNKDIREAIKYGINKEEVISLSTNSYGVPQASVLSPYQERYYNTDLATDEFDPELARKIMEENGYNQTNRLAIPLKVVSENAVNVNMANVIKSNLSDIYIDVTVQEVPWSTYLDDVYFNKNFEATILQLAGYDNPYNTMRFFSTDYKGNLSKYNNEKYDAILKQILSERDENKSIELYKEAQAMIFADTPAIFLGDEGKLIGLNAKYEGATFYPFWYIDIASIKVKK